MYKRKILSKWELRADVNLDFSKAQEFKNGVVTRLTGGVSGLMKGNKIDVVQGEAYFVDENTVRIISGRVCTNIQI